MPQMASVFGGWSRPTPMKVVAKTASDFEVDETVIKIVTIDVMLQPMKPREVARKPEGLRTWIWKTGWTRTHVQIDTVLQDQLGVEFRVDAVTDWRDAGFFVLDLVSEPAGTP